MSIKVGSNIASLQAQRRLNDTSNTLSSVYEKLSSGFRINKAADDSAGLAIATSLASDKRVFTQGIRNFNDGVSALSIAEAAIDQASSITVRIRELAEQSANGSYSNTQRIAIDAEAQALKKEFVRIAQSTKFNGLGLLDGSFQEIKLQGGYGADGSISTNVGGAIGTAAFDSVVTDTGGVSVYGINSADVNGDGIVDLILAESAGVNTLSVLYGNGSGSFGPKVSIAASNYNFDVVAADFNSDNIMDLASVGANMSVILGTGNGSFATAVSYAAGSSPFSIRSGDFNGDGKADLVSVDTSTSTINLFLGNGNGTFAARVSYAAGAGLSNVRVADFNKDGISDIVTAGTGAVSVFLGNTSGTLGSRTTYAANSGQVVTGDFNGDGNIDIISAGSSSVSVLFGIGNGTFGSQISSAAASGIIGLSAGDFNGDGLLDLAAQTTSYTAAIMLGNGSGSFSISGSYSVSSDAYQITANDFNGDGVVDLATSSWDTGNITILTGKTKFGLGPLLEFDLKTRSDALQAISPLDRKIAQLSQQRATIGAYQSRLSTALNNLSSKTEIYSAAESRIRDVDVAQESGNLIRLQIAQQAATAVLAQANQQPSLVLKLLS